METFTGVIIEESLENKSVLDKVKIISTKVEPATVRHRTPWVKQWTLHRVEVSPAHAEEIAAELSKTFDSRRSWFADFKNDFTHYVVYKDKIFKIDRTKDEEYNEATKYGLALGIPDYQVDFSKNIKKWER